MQNEVCTSLPPTHTHTHSPRFDSKSQTQEKICILKQNKSKTNRTAHFGMFHSNLIIVIKQIEKQTNKTIFPKV